MKILIQNQDGETVFTFDVNKGEAEAHVPLNLCALEFIRGLESAVMYGSQFKDGETIQDVLIQAGSGPTSGNFLIRMGGTGPNGEPGHHVEVLNPEPSAKCPDCVDGTQTLIFSSGPCTTCRGTQRVRA